MSENKTNGQIQIADEVVGVIATTAALEVEGVVAGGGKGFVEGKSKNPAAEEQIETVVEAEEHRIEGKSE